MASPASASKQAVKNQNPPPASSSSSKKEEKKKDAGAAAPVRPPKRLTPYQQKLQTIAPGTVLIVLKGKYAGRRVVYITSLRARRLLVTGMLSSPPKEINNTNIKKRQQ